MMLFVLFYNQSCVRCIYSRKIISKYVIFDFRKLFYHIVPIGTETYKNDIFPKKSNYPFLKPRCFCRKPLLLVSVQSQSCFKGAAGKHCLVECSSMFTFMCCSHFIPLVLISVLHSGQWAAAGAVKFNLITSMNWTAQVVITWWRQQKNKGHCSQHEGLKIPFY